MKKQATDQGGPSARLQRFAQESRRLAAECAEGVAPPMINWVRHDVGGRKHCALGWIEARCGGMELSVGEEEIWVADANNYEHPERLDPERRWDEVYEPASDHASRQARLVFPLFALADALEDAAEPPNE